MAIRGRCLCGAVSYRCESAPVMAANCHCIDCKRASGSGYAPTLLVAADDLAISGEVTYFESPGGSGATVRRGFCGRCGSPLFGRPQAMPGLVGIRAGSLDDPSVYRPQMDIFAHEAPEWDVMDACLARFDRMPPRER